MFLEKLFNKKESNISDMEKCKKDNCDRVPQLNSFGLCGKCFDIYTKEIIIHSLGL